MRNLANPEFEPSDEDLLALSRRAFAGVAREHEQALQRMRLQIGAERERILQVLAHRVGEPQAK